MRNIFNREKKRQNSNENLMKSNNVSEDSIDRVLNSGELEEEDKTGISSFRNKDGGPIYIQANRNDSQLSILNNQVQKDTIKSRKPSHLRSKSEGNYKPYRSKEDEEFKLPSTTYGEERGKLQVPRITMTNPGKSGRRESIVNGVEDFEEINLHQNEANENSVRQRKPISKKTSLRVNTKNQSNKIEFEDGIQAVDDNDYFALTSAISPELRESPKSLSKLKKLEPDNYPVFNKNMGQASSKENEINNLIERSVLERYDQQQNNIKSIFPEESQRQTIGEYSQLIQLLRLERIFFNPELEILNRYCLEYTGICVRTEPTRIIMINVTPHYERVYNYMIKRITSSSTPINENPVGVEVPVLITRLFLEDFRITSNGACKIGITLPTLSHSHKLSLEKFKIITDNIFAKKSKYYSKLDISRHELSHLA